MTPDTIAARYILFILGVVGVSLACCGWRAYSRDAFRQRAFAICLTGSGERGRENEGSRCGDAAPTLAAALNDDSALGRLKCRPPC